MYLMICEPSNQSLDLLTFQTTLAISLQKAKHR